jgi:hypothetical protein
MAMSNTTRSKSPSKIMDSNNTITVSVKVQDPKEVMISACITVILRRRNETQIEQERTFLLDLLNRPLSLSKIESNFEV